MKNTIILLVAAALGISATSGFSQGTISFGNDSTTLVTTNGSSAGQGTGTAAITSGSGIKVQLWYQPRPNGSVAPAPITASGVGAWVAIPTLANLAPQAGKFAAGQVTTGNDVAPAGNVWLEVVGWNLNATSLANALSSGLPNQYIGYSSVWGQGTGDGGSVGAQPIVAGGFQGLVLTPATIPEPTTIAIAGLGAAALLAFRRRK